MNTVLTILIGALLAYLCYLLVTWILPLGPLPTIVAILVFLGYVFGGDRWHIS